VSFWEEVRGRQGHAPQIWVAEAGSPVARCASIRAALFMRAIDGFEMRSILITAPILIAGIAVATSAIAQQLPLLKTGGCPPGFRESGAYCVAGEDTRTLAVPKTGPCPAGWITSGAYCKRPAERP
jgi:hypothetical protein